MDDTPGREHDGPPEPPGLKRETCKDVGGIYHVLQKYIKQPGDLFYRETLAGKLDHPTITKHLDLILALRTGPCPQGSLTKTTAQAAAAKLAEEMEETWHLGSEISLWITKFGVRLRCMMRDVQQGIFKARTAKTVPKWVQPFMPARPDAPAIAVAPPPSVPPSVAPPPVVPPPPPAQPAGAPLVPPASPSASSSSSKDQYIFAYDGDLRLAYRSLPNQKRADYCKRVTRPVGAADDDDAVAVWKDGVEWPIPTLTCAEVSSSTKVGRKVQPIWVGKFHENGSEVSLKPCSSKEKSWLIIWHNIDGKTKQILQIATHGMTEAKIAEAEVLMKNLVVDYSSGKATKDKITQEKIGFLKKTAKKTAAAKKPSSSSTAAPGGQVKKRPASSSSTAASGEQVKKQTITVCDEGDEEEEKLGHDLEEEEEEQEDPEEDEQLGADCEDEEEEEEEEVGEEHAVATMKVEEPPETDFYDV
jgi:hypothetical protein